LEEDLETARELQNALLPQQYPLEHSPHAASVPSRIRLAGGRF
jgi:hypothetical protein